VASTIDAAILALTSLLGAAPSLSGVSVFDGPPTSAETPDWITVGWSPGETAAVDVEYAWAEIGAQRHEERYDILCCLATTSGDEAMPARRARALAIRDAIAAVLFANPTLSGAVRIAHMSAAQLVQDETEQGASAGFTFRVNCQARIQS
jgi:hypothetical protein